MYSSYPQSSYAHQSYPSVSREDKLGKKLADPLLSAVRWLKRRSPREKLILAGVGALLVRSPPSHDSGKCSCLGVSSPPDALETAGVRPITAIILLLQALFLMWLVIEDHDNLFVMAEVVHFLGIGLLAYKLTKKKNAGGTRTLLPVSLDGERRLAAEATRRMSSHLCRRVEAHWC